MHQNIQSRNIGGQSSGSLLIISSDWQGHQKGVYPLVFIPASDDLGEEDTSEGPTIKPGDILITGSADMTARTWSFESAGCLKQFRGHTAAITTMQTDSNGKVLFTAGADSTIKSWNIQSAQLLKVRTVDTNQHLSSASLTLILAPDI